MRIFAPGKLVLTGAYAVLEGAPAIVMATSRGAFADSARAAEVPTPEVRAALGEGPFPHVDASALFAGDRKLGLGASAAILVASLGARAALRGEDLTAPAVRDALFTRARAAHAAAQSGGSGIDVAASVHGGVLRYVPGEAARVALPDGLRVTVLACTTSARTSELRGVVDRLAATDPREHRARLDELGAIARAAAEAVERGDAPRLVEGIRSAAAALDRLGRAAGAPIVPDGFAELAEVAAHEGAAFCVSGAGGGDVAVYVGANAPGTELLGRARALGLTVIEVEPDEKGIRVASASAGALAPSTRSEAAP